MPFFNNQYLQNFNFQEFLYFSPFLTLATVEFVFTEWPQLTV